MPKRCARTRSGRGTCLTVLSIGWFLGGGHAAAQTFRGHAVDADSGRPIVGAMLIALGPFGDVGGRTLTDDNGEFLLRVSPPFQLSSIQVVRIGYASELHVAEALSPDEPVVLRVASSPVNLEGLSVVADNLCGEEFEGSGQVHDIWLEARKTLEMTRLSESDRGLIFESERVVRILDPDDHEERELQVVPRRLVGDRPYYSLTAQQVTEIGWVETADDGSLTYHAPDATTLLSPAFSQQHCFGAEFTEDHILLRFAPNSSRRSVPEIEGEMILDREAHALAELHFRYTSTPLPPEALGHARGELHFAEAPNGVRIVSEWSITMPIVTARWKSTAAGTAVRGVRVRELREEGGRVLRIRRGSEVIDLASPLRNRAR